MSGSYSQAGTENRNKSTEKVYLEEALSYDQFNMTK